MNQFGETDITFGQFKRSLTSEALSLLEVPDEAEVGRNLVSMANYLPLIQVLIDSVAPRRICEIGAYRGISTNALAKIAQKYSGDLFVVDPAIDPDHAPVEAENITYYQMTSEEFLETPRDVDIFFIDGDHNYEVVSAELNLVVERQSAVKPPILLMHDIGWPCALRDMYYDVSRIKAVHELGSGPTIPLTKSEGAEYEVALPRAVDFAATAGGPKNGVRSAIDDFLKAQTGWRHILFPSLYGLGVVWNSGAVSEATAKNLQHLTALAQQLNPFLSTLELNRILLLSEIEKQGQVWKKNQTYIAEANQQLEQLADHIEYLKSAKGAFKQLIKRLMRRR